VNAPKAVAGVAVLVLAAFWGFLLFDMLSVIGFIIVVAAPFAVFLAIGSYMVLDGVGAMSVRPHAGATRTGKTLGVLDVTVLQMTSQKKSQEDIAAATGVSPSVISDKVESLTRAGFLLESSLTEKGFEALKGRD
jgi:hypothetical protein